MPIESATHINDLNASYPAGTDQKSTLDDHLRLVKSAVKTTFPNVSGAVTPTHTELNYVDGVTSAIQTQLDAKMPKAGTNEPMTGVKYLGFYAEYDNGNSGTSKTVTLTNGQKQKLTLTGNVTITVDATGCVPGSYQLRLIQDATGSRTVTWSGLSSSRWLGATSAPSVNSAANKETIVTIFVPEAASLTNAVQSMAKVGAV